MIRSAIPFQYFGGKARLAPAIIGLMPPHSTYIEPYCGSAAVLFAKTPARLEIINDLSDEVVTFFRVLRDRPDELRRVLELTPYARAEFHAARHGQPTSASDSPVDEVERARRFFVRAAHGFAGSVGKSGWPVDSKRIQAFISKVDRITVFADRLRRVAIDNRDALDLIARHVSDPDTVIYADPPYLASTRTEPRNYLIEASDEEHHRALAATVRDAAAIVMVSGYSSPLYEELYADWHRHEVEVHKSSSRRRNARAVEVVWTNRNPTTKKRP